MVSKSPKDRVVGPLPNFLTGFAMGVTNYTYELAWPPQVMGICHPPQENKMHVNIIVSLMIP